MMVSDNEDLDLSYPESSYPDSSSDEDEDDDDDDDGDYEENDDKCSLKSSGGVSSRDLDALSRLLPPRVDPRPMEDVDVETFSTSATGAENGKTFFCSFEGCTKTFGKPSRLETHIRTHTGERPFRCDIPGCHKAYSRNQHLKRHLQAHEKGDSGLRRRLEKVQRSRNEAPTSEVRPTKKLLLSEISRVKRDPASTPSSSSTSSSAFPCTFSGCDKVLASERSLKAHMNIHGGVRFSCTLDGCSQSYPTLKSLKRHEKEFHGPKTDPVLCPDTPSESEWEGNNNCAKKDTNDDDDDSDRNSNFDQSSFKTYSCSSCDKFFKKHWQLKTHSYDHTGVLPFKCKESACDRAFLYRCHLRRHVKQSHSLHRCQLHPQCEAIFKSSLEALRHFRQTHKGRKACPECGKSVKADRVKAHLETHSEVRKVFPCPIKDCDRQFLAKKNLVAHLKTNHGVVGGSVANGVEVGSIVNDDAIAGVNGVNNNNNGDDALDVEMSSPVRIPCTISGCDGTFVSKATRDRHVRNLHEKRDRGEEVPKRPRTCKPRKDFAKELTGFYQDRSGPAESEEGRGSDGKEEGEKEDGFVLKSLNLPTRHDNI